MKDFRFGVGLWPKTTRAAWQDTARRAEGLGFDVLHVPDHLGAPAPFPALVSAADVTSVKVGTFVLNAGFYKPALLARDVGALDMLTDGRFELGLGAGYVREEFEAAELPFLSAGRRVEYLGHVTRHLRERMSTVPILIAGSGDRLLTLAAQQADIIGIAGGRPDSAAPDPLAERAEFVRRAAGDRFNELELNLAITAVPHDNSGVPDLSLTRRYAPTLSDAELLELPGVLSGSPRDIADRLRRHRDTYGLTYFTVQEHHAEGFSKVIAELR
ncbi:MAG: TIGR03621 family F420-dependent LLM class oxidoreductase [Mycobacteriaceae bacterium]|nr:TIGR03621 family F420-dependent LLM class oxidoreductase [Mycobacteriaceae bacterium]MBV9641364.1 TIGR03621 family F420-dependent LLM class oxidoreductase [Mycobacteriaceae bacterium]